LNNGENKMNERIQALINQSWQNVEGAPREGMEDIRQALMEELNPVFLEFARLMVRECMTICGAIQGAAEYKNMQDFAAGAAKCKEIIERDFGVE
jgi:hypothetical protein